MSSTYNDKPSEEVLSKSLGKIKARLDGEPVGGHLERGALEKILADQHHRAREGLVWRNAMFGGGQPFSISENFGLRCNQLAVVLESSNHQSGE